MGARNPQTQAKRARELALQERRERKREKKAAAAARRAAQTAREQADAADRAVAEAEALLHKTERG
jgi:hypothetical protein